MVKGLWPPVGAELNKLSVAVNSDSKKTDTDTEH